MICNVNLFLILFSVVCYLPHNVCAQGASEDVEMLVSDTKSDLLMVVGGGLAGAILGLSTLSFVEEPKDHTRNITVGASIGIIIGVGAVAFKQANKTQDMIYSTGGEMDEEAYLQQSKEFDTYVRADWHHENLGQHASTIISPYNATIRFTF